MSDVESDDEMRRPPPKAEAKGTPDKDKEQQKEKMKKVAFKRRKDLRNSDSDMSDSGGSEEFVNDGRPGSAGGGGTIMDKLKKALRNGAKAFARSFVDYGPPYQIHKDGLELEPCPVVDCCSEMNMSYVKLHRLLNDHMDPNIPDPFDFYFTAMHYAGRHLHFLAARMIRRAGAQVNVVNEWGQTPLTLCCMNVIAHETDTRRQRQFKMATWLIEQGANVNHRDKGGYEALDFACMNNELPLIKLLIENGAKLRRDNFDVRAKRGALLEYIAEPDVYKYILDHLKVEEDSYQRIKQAKVLAKAEYEHDKAAQKNLAGLAKRKEKKLVEQRAALEFERHLLKLSVRKKNIEQAMYSLTSGKKLKDSEHGEWIADEQRNWHWESRSATRGADEVSKRIHDTAVMQIKKLHRKNKKTLYNDRWAKMGGNGSIEAPWTREAQFVVDGVTDVDEIDENDGAFDDEDADRDENDDLLNGEDLGDFDDLLSQGSTPSHLQAQAKK